MVLWGARNSWKNLDVQGAAVRVDKGITNTNENTFVYLNEKLMYTKHGVVSRKTLYCGIWLLFTVMRGQMTSFL